MHFRSSGLVRGATAAAVALTLSGAGVAASNGSEVRVQSKVQAVAHTAGPASISLNPGESREVVIKIAANFRWRLSIATANPAIKVGQAELSGRPGGFSAPGNTLKVQFQCEADAPEPQSGEIVYSIEKL